MSSRRSDPVAAGLVGLDRGLDPAGRIRREGELSRVAPVFQPLLAEVGSALRQEFGNRLHSLYLYGSVPRGTAVPGRSDLDVSVVLRDDVVGRDRERTAGLEVDLQRGTTVVDGIGILLDPRTLFLEAAERYDGAFHLSCLCTPWWGPDLGEELPEQRPTVELAYGLGRGADAALRSLADDIIVGRRPLPVLRRAVGRRLLRLAFTTVLARWPGWSSDPGVLTRVITACYPDRADELTRLARLGWGRLTAEPAADATTAAELLDLVRGSGAWWLAEWRATTGSAVSPAPAVRP